MRKVLCFTLTSLILLVTTVFGGANDPITGEQYDRLLKAQQIELQRQLEIILPESEGFFVTGPFDPLFNYNNQIDRILHSVRVICPDHNLQKQAVERLHSSQLEIKSVQEFLEEHTQHNKYGYRGVLISIVFDGQERTVQLLTIQQMRWLIRARQVYPLLINIVSHKFDDINSYACAVSDYLHAIDKDQLDYPEPKAVGFGLPEEIDLYATPPDYVISGYQNYIDYLYSYSEIKTDFAHGILAFIPTDSTLQALKKNAPGKAYPNKEWPMLQEEYRKFFARGGDPRTMQTLTKEGFDTLKTREYFFAVGVAGKVRFGRELPRAEVKRIEEKTGMKVPRANHAFLFPGEPILTAGAFFIESRQKPRLAKVNAQSGHYFYSNVSSTIREDISLRSDHYLLTLGHFFRALDSLGISYDSVLISKL